MRSYTRNKCFGCSLSPTADVPFLSCSRCKGAEYCSLDCQKNDFRQHKRACKKLGKLRTTFENKFFENEQIKSFLLNDNDFDMEPWIQLKANVNYLHDHLVLLVRNLQPLVEEFIILGQGKESMYPIEKALLWLFRGLKVVAFHTQDIRRGKDEEKFLCFGGDWETNGEAASHHEEIPCCCPDDEKDCKTIRNERYQRENSPKGLADPFFCFGGKQNLPEVFTLMGRYQEAMDYINHWTNGLDTENHGYVEQLKKWHNKDYEKVNIYANSDLCLEWELFDGEQESKVLLRIYGVLLIVRLYVLSNIRFIRWQHKKQFQSFLLGTHRRLGGESAVSHLSGVMIPLEIICNYVINDPSESETANQEYLFELFNDLVTMSANCMYYITGDDMFMSRVSLMGVMCVEDPHSEIQRLVWSIFQWLCEEAETRNLADVYKRMMKEEDEHKSMAEIFMNHLSPFDFFDGD